jgi:hypothetical protein
VDIPVYQKTEKHDPDVAIDFWPFIKELEKDKGYNTYDFAGQGSDDWHNLAFKEVTTKFGLDVNDKSWISNTKTRTPAQWDAWWAYSKKIKERPLLNFILWIEDHQFTDLVNGSYQHLNKNVFKQLKGKQDDWVKQILIDIFEACKGHPALNKDSITFYVWW